MTTVVLGAGLAGLSCARHLGAPALILEKERLPGGVARSFKRQGFTFDCTGHWLHLKDAGVRKLVDELLPGQMVAVSRKAQIHSHGVRTAFPFQANTYGLPVQVIRDCLLGYFRAREDEAAGRVPAPHHFEDYIRQKLGDGIAQHFMIPYNTKLWTVPPSEMSFTWCERFVPVPKPEDVVLGALTPGGAAGLGYNASFVYPRAGGIGRLPEALAAGLPGELRLGAEVTAVDWRRRRVTFAGGEAAYHALVSTLPLVDLVARLTDAPPSIRDAAASLRAVSVTYWDIGLLGANRAEDAHWIYFPEPDVPFYRAGSTSAAVKSAAPAGCRSLYVEVSHPGGKPCGVGDTEVLAGLRRVGLLGEREEPLFVERSLIPCAYVIMDHTYGAARARILDWLQGERILSVGRYGAWTYDSMEGAIVQGREAATRVRELS